MGGPRKRKENDKTNNIKMTEETCQAITPEKKIKILKTNTNDVSIIVWHYILQDGTTLVCRNFDEALLYEQEYEQIIDERHCFETEEEYKTFLELNPQNTKLAIDAKAKEEIKNAKAAAKDKANALAQRIIQNRERNKPKNRFHLLYRTVPMCTKAYIILRYVNIKGQHLFYAKPRNLIDCTKSYLDEVGNEELTVDSDETVTSMINKMTHYRMRDHDSAPDSVMVTINKGNGKRYEEELAVTEMDIPNCIISQEEEDTYIHNKLRLFGQTILELQATESFKLVLQKELHENIFKWMYGGPGTDVKFTFQMWCQHADIEIEKCENFNTWITLEDANKLKMLMLQNRCPPRYRQLKTPESSPIQKPTDTEMEHIQNQPVEENATAEI